MHVPSAHFIPGRDPSIRRNKTKYMPVPLDPTSGWGFAPILDWARGLTPRQASFQTLGWVLSSSIGRASPSSGLVIGDGVDNNNAKHFVSDYVRDDDSLKASHCCCIMM